MQIKFRRLSLLFPLLVLGGVLLGGCGGSGTAGDNTGATTPLEFLSVSGNKIADKNGNEVRLRGYQIDFGSLCGDLGGYAITDNILSLCDAMLDTIVDEADFAEAKNMGANALRFSLSTCLDYEAGPYVYKESNLRKLDTMIGWAEKYNIRLILSMRQSPGGHNTSPHSGNEGKNELWGNAEHQKRIASLWKTIAARYADRPIIIGYDLLNEPVAPTQQIFTSVMEQITSAIREVDQKHILFVEGNDWGKDLAWTNLLADANTALSIHFYVPGSYAVDGSGTYPSIISGQNFDKVALRNSLAQFLGSAGGRPVVVGEFGAMTSAGNYLAYDNDLISLFEEQNIGWIYWQQKNIRGKSDTQAFYYANQNNAFVALLPDMGKRDFSSQEIQQAAEALRTSNFIAKQDIVNMLVNAYVY